MRTNRRADRVAEAIREEVATFLATQAKDPRIVGFVTVTAVDVTQDLRHARVFVSVYGTETERASTIDGLISSAPAVRSHIAHAVKLRIVPEIEFKIDDSIARAARIEELLAQVKRDDNNPDPDHPDHPTTNGSGSSE
jgi:ribosome-binding factor A